MDELDKQVIRSGSLALSSKRSALTKARQALETKPTLSDVVKILGTFSAVYGEPKSRTTTSAEVMAAAWHRALGHMPLAALLEAAQAHIRGSRFWPTPAEIIELALESAADLRRRVAWAREDLEGRRQALEFTRGNVDDAAPFAPTAEELARVSALCANWRRQFADAETLNERMDAWAPASQEQGASEALKAAAAKLHASGQQQHYVHWTASG